MSVLLTAAMALAAAPADVDPTTGRGAEWGKAAPIGLLVLLLMCIAVFFLLRSMTRNMRKVPASFTPPDTTDVVAEPAPPSEDDTAEGRGEAELPQQRTDTAADYQERAQPR